MYSLGVYLKSNCKIYTENGSIIPINEIGEGDDALLCFTDLRECCRRNHTLVSKALGEWLYPDREEVETLEKSHPDHRFYRNRDRSVVRLNLRKNAAMAEVIIGQFCCKVPDATSSLVTICINVSDSGNYSSSGMVSQDEHCKLSTNTAPGPGPVTSMNEG